ncbi:MAG: hypothetical protein HY320_08215 [Armatimonadetes bacterium]|nr:hypothetical protein [Armatimonadota bacterium]
MARYKRSLKGSGISLECATENAPDDGCYHVLRDGRIVSSHRTLKAATGAYRALLEESGALLEQPSEPPAAQDPRRLVGEFYVYGKARRRGTGTRTYG